MDRDKDMQHGYKHWHATWTQACRMYMDMDMHDGHVDAAWTWTNMDMDKDMHYAAWIRTCRMYMNVDIQHGHGQVAWTWIFRMNLDKQRGLRHAPWIRTSSMDMDLDMQHERGHGQVVWTWTYRMDTNMQMDIEMNNDLEHRHGHKIWSMEVDMQHRPGHVAWNWSCSMDHNRHAPWSRICTMDAGMPIKRLVQHCYYSVILQCLMRLGIPASWSVRNHWSGISPWVPSYADYYSQYLSFVLVCLYLFSGPSWKAQTPDDIPLGSDKETFVIETERPQLTRRIRSTMWPSKQSVGRGFLTAITR